jgi:hypothetical protein
MGEIDIPLFSNQEIYNAGKRENPNNDSVCESVVINNSSEEKMMGGN